MSDASAPLTEAGPRDDDDGQHRLQLQRRRWPTGALLTRHFALALVRRCGDIQRFRRIFAAQSGPGQRSSVRRATDAGDEGLRAITTFQFVAGMVAVMLEQEEVRFLPAQRYADRCDDMAVLIDQGSGLGLARAVTKRWDTLATAMFKGKRRRSAGKAPALGSSPGVLPRLFEATAGRRDSLPETTEGSDGSDAEARAERERVAVEADTMLAARDPRSVAEWEDAVEAAWQAAAPQATNGEMDHFCTLSVLEYALLDLHRKVDEYNTGLVTWAGFMLYVSDCALDAPSALLAVGDIYLPGGAATIPAIALIQRLWPWPKRRLVIALTRDDRQNQRLLLLDAATFDEARSFTLPRANGKVLDAEPLTPHNAIALSTFTGFRIYDADTWVCKCACVTPHMLSCIRWVDRLGAFVCGTNTGAVVQYDLSKMDRQYFSTGRTVTDVPHQARAAHGEQVTDILREMPHNFLVSAAMDGSVVMYNAETGSARCFAGAVTLRFVLCEPLGYLFAHGVDGVPFLWSYNVPNSAPAMLTQGARPHEARCMGVALLSDVTQGLSVDVAGVVKVWDLAQAVCLQSIRAAGSDSIEVHTTFAAWYLHAPHSYNILLATKHKAFRLKYNPKLRGGSVSKAAPHPITATVYDPRTRVLFAAAGGTVMQWNVVTCGLQHHFDVYTVAHVTQKDRESLSSHAPAPRLAHAQAQAHAAITDPSEAASSAVSVGQGVPVRRTPHGDLLPVADRISHLALAPHGTTLYVGGGRESVAAVNVGTGQCRAVVLVKDLRGIQCSVERAAGPSSPPLRGQPEPAPRRRSSLWRQRRPSHRMGSEVPVQGHGGALPSVAKGRTRGAFAADGSTAPGRASKTAALHPALGPVQGEPIVLAMSSSEVPVELVRRRREADVALQSVRMDFTAPTRGRAALHHQATDTLLLAADTDTGPVLRCWARPTGGAWHPADALTLCDDPLATVTGIFAAPPPGERFLVADSRGMLHLCRVGRRDRHLTRLAQWVNRRGLTHDGAVVTAAIFHDECERLVVCGDETGALRWYDVSEALAAEGQRTQKVTVWQVAAALGQHGGDAVTGLHWVSTAPEPAASLLFTAGGDGNIFVFSPFGRQLAVLSTDSPVGPLAAAAEASDVPALFHDIEAVVRHNDKGCIRCTAVLFVDTDDGSNGTDGSPASSGGSPARRALVSPALSGATGPSSGFFLTEGDASPAAAVSAAPTARGSVADAHTAAAAAKLRPHAVGLIKRSALARRQRQHFADAPFTASRSRPGSSTLRDASPTKSASVASPRSSRVGSVSVEASPRGAGIGALRRMVGDDSPQPTARRRSSRRNGSIVGLREEESQPGWTTPDQPAHEAPTAAALTMQGLGRARSGVERKAGRTVADLGLSHEAVVAHFQEWVIGVRMGVEAGAMAGRRSAKTVALHRALASDAEAVVEELLQDDDFFAELYPRWRRPEPAAPKSPDPGLGLTLTQRSGRGEGHGSSGDDEAEPLGATRRQRRRKRQQRDSGATPTRAEDGQAFVSVSPRRTPRRRDDEDGPGVWDAIASGAEIAPGVDAIAAASLPPLVRGAVLRRRNRAMLREAVGAMRERAERSVAEVAAAAETMREMPSDRFRDTLKDAQLRSLALGSGGRSGPASGGGSPQRPTVKPASPPRFPRAAGGFTVERPGAGASPVEVRAVPHGRARSVPQLHRRLPLAPPSAATPAPKQAPQRFFSPTASLRPPPQTEGAGPTSREERREQRLRELLAAPRGLLPPESWVDVRGTVAFAARPEALPKLPTEAFDRTIARRNPAPASP